MNDDAKRNTSEQASEEARRFYRDNHGASATGGADETIVKASAPGAAEAEAEQGRTEAAPSPQAKAAPRDDDAANPSKVDSSLSLGETKSQGSDGPHILDRSFSGTYKD